MRLQRPSTKTRLMFAALCVLVFALGASANAAGRKVLKITTPTEIGGAVLQPGSYMVREVEARDGLELEFVQEFRNPTVPDGSRPDEIVARVKACKQPLSTRAEKTKLQLAPDATSAVALQVRGKRAQYLFPSSQGMYPNAMASPGEAGSLRCVR